MGQCQRRARRSKIKHQRIHCIPSARPRPTAEAVGMLVLPPFLLSPAAGTVSLPWLDCGKTLSRPLFWAVEETTSSTVVCSTWTPVLTALRGASLLTVCLGEPCVFPECVSLGLSILHHLNDSLIKKKSKKKNWGKV